MSSISARVGMSMPRQDSTKSSSALLGSVRLYQIAVPAKLAGASASTSAAIRRSFSRIYARSMSAPHSRAPAGRHASGALQGPQAAGIEDRLRLSGFIVASLGERPLEQALDCRAPAMQSGQWLNRRVVTSRQGPGPAQKLKASMSDFLRSV